MARALTSEELAKWGELLAMAESAMDDSERSSYEKRRAKDAEVLSDGRRRYEHPEREAAIRFLIEYAKCEGRFMECVRASGATKLEVTTATSTIPEVRAVYKHVRGVRERLSELENEDIVADAREAMRRLLTESECELNAKAAIFALERLDRKSFGSVKAEGDGERAQVVYNIPNLTVNMISAPSVEKAGGDVIEVKPEAAKEVEWAG